MGSIASSSLIHFGLSVNEAIILLRPDSLHLLKCGASGNVWYAMHNAREYSLNTLVVELGAPTTTTPSSDAVRCSDGTIL